VYEESSPIQAEMYMKSLDTNDKTFSSFSEMIDLMSDMDDALLEPSKSCVNQILLYAKKSREVAS
jgi:hypothetical protein